MQKFPRIAIVLTMVVVLAGFSSVWAAPQASATSFHFVFTADSRDDYTVLPALSHKMVTLSPIFGFFAGDLCGSFDVACINNQWKPALDGNDNDGMLAKTFVSRGNHDSGTLSTWQGLWDFSGMAARVGATFYSTLTNDATYSFDYGNSHFAVIDLPSGGSSSWTSAEITWLDSDLSAAEGRGIVHEFIFSHGPMYGVTTQHGSEQPSSALKAVLNKHPISAGFHGHEHVTAYTHVTPSVETGINDYEQFTLGRAGAPPYSVAKPADWHADQNAFADVAISGNDFTVTIYSQSGASLFSKTFTDAGATATSTAGATSTLAATSTPRPTSTPGASPTPGTTLSSVTYRSSAGYDGQVLETGETSGLGGTINATGTTFNIGDDSSNRQYRAVLSFNTSGLPDNALISSVTLKIKQAGQAGASPFSSMGNIMGDIIAGPFSGSNSLQSADFQATSNKSSALSIPNTPASGWYSKALSSTYFGFINKTGVTQVRLRFATDDNNNHIGDYLKFYTGETGTTTDRPALVIKYTVP